MNVLNFLADVIVEEGETTATEESMTCIEYKKDFQYFFITNKDGKYYYQYISFFPRNTYNYDDKFRILEDLLYDKSEEEQCQVVKVLMTTEVEGLGDANDSYMKYPLYSVRGTCGKKCLSEKCPNRDFEHCCNNKVIGYTGTNFFKYPEPLEILESILGWLCVCPDLDIVFVVHDWYPSKIEDLFYQTAFHVKNGVIKVVDEAEAEKLYKEYHEKYPYDMEEVERWLRDLCAN